MEGSSLQIHSYESIFVELASGEPEAAGPATASAATDTATPWARGAAQITVLILAHSLALSRSRNRIRYTIAINRLLIHWC